MLSDAVAATPKTLTPLVCMLLGCGAVGLVVCCCTLVRCPLCSLFSLCLSVLACAVVPFAVGWGLSYVCTTLAESMEGHCQYSVFRAGALLLDRCCIPRYAVPVVGGCGRGARACSRPLSLSHRLRVGVATKTLRHSKRAAAVVGGCGCVFSGVSRGDSLCGCCIVEVCWAEDYSFTCFI